MRGTGIRAVVGNRGPGAKKNPVENRRENCVSDIRLIIVAKIPLLLKGIGRGVDCRATDRKDTPRGMTPPTRPDGTSSSWVGGTSAGVSVGGASAGPTSSSGPSKGEASTGPSSSPASPAPPPVRALGGRFEFPSLLSLFVLVFFPRQILPGPQPS